MKAILSIALAFGLVNPLVVRAAKVTAFNLFYLRFYVQTDASQPLAPVQSDFDTNIYLDGPLSSAEAILFLPSATQGTSMASGGTVYSLQKGYPTQEDLDMAFPPGQYRYTLNSPDLMPVTGETAELDVPKVPNYTNVPYFTNFAAIQTIDAAKPFTFNWNPLIPFQPPLTAEIDLAVYDDTTNGNPVSVSIADNTATSYSVPANTLVAGHRYTAYLYFQIRNANAGLGFANVAGLLSYDNATIVSFTTNVQTDFNGDGHPDFALFSASTGQTAIWYLNDNVRTGTAYGPTLPAGWSVAGVADFNGDGKPDYLLFSASTSQTAIWYLNDNVRIGTAYGPTLPAGWSVVGVADFNGDGSPDFLLFDASTRQTAIWYMNDAVRVGTAYGPTLPAGWTVAGVADFNADGKPDYLLFNASTLQTAIWYMNNNVFASSVYGPTLPSGWVVLGAADFNADGMPDYVLFNASTLQTAIWYLNGTVHMGGAYGPTLPTGWSLVAP